MEKQDFINAIHSIGTCTDESERLTQLADLENEVSQIFDSNSDLIEKNTNLTDDNEKLRQANMKLFLQVGATKSGSEVIKEKTGIDPEPEVKRDFENLFDEKGGIK